MNCCEFREKYSDFVDGQLTSAERAAARAHLDVCAACRRFDAALRAGLRALRGLPRVGVSRAFGPRLRQRLRGELAVRAPIVARWSGAVGTLLLLATVGFIGWDVLQSHAAHGANAAGGARAWKPVPLPLVVADPNSVFPDPLRNSANLRTDPFHPLNSILVTVEARPVAVGDRLRFDVPAVWGGP